MKDLRLTEPGRNDVGLPVTLSTVEIEFVYGMAKMFAELPEGTLLNSGLDENGGVILMSAEESAEMIAAAQAVMKTIVDALVKGEYVVPKEGERLRAV
jgi:hypothetical protein